MSVWLIALALVVLAGLVLAAAPLLGRRVPWDVEDRTELDRLLEEKGRILRTVKDLDHEHEAGLLSDADWKESRREQVAAAARLNREVAALTGVDSQALLRDDVDAPAEAERIA